MAVDALALNAAVVLAFLVRFGWPVPAYNFKAYLLAAVPVTAGELFILSLVDLYNPTAERTGLGHLGVVAKGIVLGSLVLTTLTFFLRAFAFPRSVILIALPIQILLVWGWRMLAARVLRIRWPERRVMLVGAPADCQEIERRLLPMKRWGYRVVGTVATDQVDTLADRLNEARPQTIIFATPSKHRQVLEQVVLTRTFEGEIYVVPQLYEIHLGEVNFSLLSDIPLLRLKRASSGSWRHGLKNLAERVLAAFILIVSIPLMMLIAFAILVTSGPPVIYRQVRVGKDLLPFTLLKFRTMVSDAEPDGPRLAEENDPRVTPVGRILRRTRLDELPQFLNVLKGDMSIVGPRPERPELVQEYLELHPLYKERFRVRPGITGLSQVSATYSTSPFSKLRFDLMYIHHESLSLDLRIIAQTVKVILTGRGAR